MSKRHQIEAAALASKLESLRRRSGLALDIDGNWWHDGTAFEHSGIIAALNKGIDLHPESGEPIVRVGKQWCYIEAAGTTPFLAMRLHIDGTGHIALKLNTNQSTNTIGASWQLRFGALHCLLADDRLVRLSRHAQAQIADYLTETEDGYRIVTAAGEWLIEED